MHHHSSCECPREYRTKAGSDRWASFEGSGMRPTASALHKRHHFKNRYHPLSVQRSSPNLSSWPFLPSFSRSADSANLLRAPFSARASSNTCDTLCCTCRTAGFSAGWCWICRFCSLLRSEEMPLLFSQKEQITIKESQRSTKEAELRSDAEESDSSSFSLDC